MESARMGETLLARTRFQAFLFAGGVISIFYSLAGQTSDQAARDRIIDRIFLTSLVAMAIFVLALILQAIRPVAGIANDLGARPNPDVQAWPTPQDVRLARGFMVLGLLIYMGYHFLDGFVIDLPAKVLTVLYIRIGVSTMIGTLWLLSFTDLFRRHYVVIVTAATSLAGAGIGAMMLEAGPRVHFYYQGFIQVIAFAAFAFRLPPTFLACECAFLLSLYTGIVAYQIWQPGIGFIMERELQAAVVNNFVSLVTFVTLALTASIALGRDRQQVLASGVG
jgi:hypothetical protein